MTDRDRPGIDEWRAKLDEHLDSGGCMETAQAASEERENTDTRRGVVRKVGTAMATVLGLGATSEPIRASPLPFNPAPTVEGYYCSGEVDVGCARNVVEDSGIACFPCVYTPNPGTCVPCVGYLVFNGPLGDGECCTGGEWRRY